jgi:hypothetical protein
MLERQQEGLPLSDPVRLEASIQMFALACPAEPADRWDLLRTLFKPFSASTKGGRTSVLSNRSDSASKRRMCRGAPAVSWGNAGGCGHECSHLGSRWYP